MATITTINATDLVSASRAVINTNFSNLNTDKVDTGSSYSNPAWLTALATTKLTGTLQAAQFPALTGDVTTSAGGVATTLANTAVTPASYGSATQVATFTVDSKGRLTAAASTSIAIAASQVTSGTLDNARTTAASTNTVSAIVARDASGNFAAGTITATFSGNLTGNVTGNASGTAATITGALALANTPLTTRGDLLVATTATPILGRLAKGTQYQVLLGGATDPTWGAVDLSQASAITGTLPVGNGGTGATTLAGADIVAGAASITTANALLIGASAGVLGQSDVSLASGIFSRAGTLGLSATGANVLTFSTNGSERGRFASTGAFGIGTNDPQTILHVVGYELRLQNNGNAINFYNAAAARKGYILQNNGAGLDIAQDAAQPIAFVINSSEAGRWSAGRNLLIGTTADDGSGSKVQVAGVILANGASAGLRLNTRDTGSDWLLYSSSVGFSFYSTTANAGLFSIASSGTATVYNPVAVTGVTSLVVRAGAGQSTTALQSWQINNGTEFGKVWVNAADDYRILLNGTGSVLLAQITGTAWLSASGASTDLVLGTIGTERVRIQASDPGVKFATTTKIGFFGVTPVARAAALTAADASALTSSDATVIGNMRTRVGEIATALQNLGLIN